MGTGLAEIVMDVTVAVVTCADADSVQAPERKTSPSPRGPRSRCCNNPRPGTEWRTQQDTALSTLVAAGWSGLGAMAQVVPDSASIDHLVIGTRCRDRPPPRTSAPTGRPTALRTLVAGGLVQRCCGRPSRDEPAHLSTRVWSLLPRGVVVADGVARGGRGAGHHVKPLKIGPWSTGTPSFYIPLANNSTRARSLFPV